jgi:hypothetical protein
VDSNGKSTTATAPADNVTGIVIGLIWLLFLGLWLLFYASGFSILQNIGIFFLSLVVVAILETAIWVPWGMKQMPGWRKS